MKAFITAMAVGAILAVGTGLAYRAFPVSSAEGYGISGEANPGAVHLDQ